jgi:predicted nucleic acid-binding protein
LHDGIEVDESDVLLDAFDRFGKVNVDFIDCHAAALAKSRDSVVVTEDRDFRKFADVTALRPEEVVRQFEK